MSWPVQPIAAVLAITSCRMRGWSASRRRADPQNGAVIGGAATVSPIVGKPVSGDGTRRISRRALGRMRHKADVAFSSEQSRTRTLSGKLSRSRASARNRVERRAQAEWSAESRSAMTRAAIASGSRLIGEFPLDNGGDGDSSCGAECAGGVNGVECAGGGGDCRNARSTAIVDDRDIYEKTSSISPRTRASEFWRVCGMCVMRHEKRKELCSTHIALCSVPSPARAHVYVCVCEEIFPRTGPGCVRAEVEGW
jgi:hypothetical protein